MKKGSFVIPNELGLHARASSRLVDVSSRFVSDVQIGKDRMVDAKSILQVMMLAAPKGTEVQLQVEGIDEEEAFTAVSTAIMEGFGEL